MKKVLVMALAVVVSVAFVTVTFAQTPEKQTTTTTATPEKKETTTTTETTKSKGMRHHSKRHHYAGEVVSMDTAAKTLVVKGKKGEMTFDVSSAKMKDEPKAGDKVTVKYMKKEGMMVASWVTMGRHTRTKTTTTKTTETKEDATAPAK